MLLLIYRHVLLKCLYTNIQSVIFLKSGISSTVHFAATAVLTRGQGNPRFITSRPWAGPTMNRGSICNREEILFKDPDRLFIVVLGTFGTTLNIQTASCCWNIIAYDIATQKNTFLSISVCFNVSVLSF